ncbi:hypothetical protein FDP41_004679 [Naegleria fowleri]|uniref:Uncharacterized protein n=1 Tax=Naegleria fowleri TaxID=5763 RepID=A0A6A5BSA0_NAEFO|nr:uncharacterized protein FDP41_004679 [Naegleria fowleri]KAF0976305.1 hypothetical protein FDP41_004679 [Naegleria fowleri]
MIHWPNVLASLRKVYNQYIQKNPRFTRIMNILWYAVMIIGLLPLLLVIFKRKDPSEDSQRNTGQSTQQQQNRFGSSSSAGKSSGLFGKVCLNAKAFLLDQELYENNSSSKIQREENIMEITSSTTTPENDYANDELASDEEQNYYQDLLESKYGFFNPVKILFCETVKGKIAFSRQINPQLVIEVDKETTRELKRFYEGVCMVQRMPKTPRMSTTFWNFQTFGSDEVFDKGLIYGNVCNYYHGLL